ncbi:MAG: radical SAM protein [Halioglobus sp.]|nr:radical SAM protein [Halioglobus sp.]
MDAKVAKLTLLPNAKLQIVIGADSVIRVWQAAGAPPIELGFSDLELLQAFSQGLIPNIKEGLQRYLDGKNLPEAEREHYTTLAKRLNRQRRFDAIDRSNPAQRALLPAPRPNPNASFDATIPDGPLKLLTPCAFFLHEGKFATISHNGISLPPITIEEILALSQLATHHTVEEALQAHREARGNHALDKAQFLAMIKPFIAHRYIVPLTQRKNRSGAELFGLVLSGNSSDLARDMFRRHAKVQDDAEQEREQRTGKHRVKVIPVAFDVCPPLALGSIVAYAKVHEEGALEEFYNFRTDWIWDDDRLAGFTKEPAIYLFSNYLWSHAQSVEASERIKALSPNSITIHGGPDTPKYEEDQHRHFANHPHIDITIQGEGEVVCAEVLSKLRTVIGDPQPDFSVLDGIPGVTYRTPTGIVRNEKQGRISDLSVLPSAYLTGLFDTYYGLDDLFLIMETNRGCPYGCTFCDWGSATASKIRNFDIDRVMAELEWAATTEVATITLADANFGIFPRDVDIARKAAQLKIATGFPRGFGGNFAKNSVKYLKDIIDVLAEGNILTLGTLSLQSMDENTLDVINRANIKTEKYDALAVEMRNSGLPLTIELMMGLPGSTLASFCNDLQQCIDRELSTRVNLTTLLVNSPMNEPAYLEKHKIKTLIPVAPGKQAVLASTATYTEDDLATMTRLKQAYTLFENFGVLRTITRFVRQETAVSEMEFYHKLLEDAADDKRWPMLFVLNHYVSSLMAPPVSWYLVMEEMGRYLQEEYGMEDSPALRSILAAQLASIPAHDRALPETVNLECDVVAWHAAMIEEKASGNRQGWGDVTPRLSSYGPGTLTVDDPFGITASSVGISRDLNSFGISWELESPLHRARVDLA